MRVAIFLILGIGSAGCLAAQPAALTGPVEAYTFDAPTRSLRAVIGFPGAASFGPVLRDGLDFASAAPGQNYALGFQEGKCLLISGLGAAPLSGQLLVRPISGVEAQPEGIVWSGDGSVAVLYSSTGNWLQTLSGLPNTPLAAARVSGSSLGGLLASVAADGHGKHIAAGISGEAGAVYLSSDGQTFNKLISLAHPISLSFSADGSTLYVLDSSAPQVLAVMVGSHTYQALPLRGLADPIALQAVQDSQNRQLLYVASTSDRLLRILDVASQQTVADVPLSFQPTGLEQFGSSSFVVASRSQAAKPLWLFASTPQPGAYFVPAVQLRSPDHGRAGIVRGRR
jgi:hypothetical protein